jgi:aspartate oxidase
LWQAVRDRLQGDGLAAVRARETAAIAASARWSYTAALNRRETRGLHRREDQRSMLPQFERRQLVSGLDRIRSSFESTSQLLDSVA